MLAYSLLFMVAFCIDPLPDGSTLVTEVNVKRIPPPPQPDQPPADNQQPSVPFSGSFFGQGSMFAQPPQQYTFNNQVPVNVPLRPYYTYSYFNQPSTTAPINFEAELQVCASLLQKASADVEVITNAYKNSQNDIKTLQTQLTQVSTTYATQLANAIAERDYYRSWAIRVPNFVPYPTPNNNIPVYQRQQGQFFDGYVPNVNPANAPAHIRAPIPAGTDAYTRAAPPATTPATATPAPKTKIL